MALLPVAIGIVVLAGGSGWGLWCVAGKKSSRELRVWLLLLFCCISGWIRMGLEEAEKPWDGYLALTGGRKVEIRGEIQEISEREKSLAITLKKCVMVWEGKEYEMPKVLVYGDKEDAVKLRLGMRVSMYGKPEKPKTARNPGEFDFCRYYRARGIWYQMFSDDVNVEDPDYDHYRDGIYRLKLAAEGVLERICEPEDKGIFQAAILGDSSDMDEQVRELYQRSGIAHLLAISGLHISLVGLLVYRLLRKAGLGYGMSGIVGAVVIISYGCLTGATASVVRAVMMVLVMMLAEYLGRNYDMLSAAALAAILLLLKSPYLMFQAGFQLSFGAVAAIGGVGPWMVKEFGGKHVLRQTLMVGMAIQLVTYPMLLYHFFQYPVYGIFLNLLVVPLMQYVIFSGAAGMTFGAVHEGLGMLMLGSGHYILRFYDWICGMTERLPGFNLIIGRPELWQIVVYYGILGIGWWRLGRMREREYESHRWSRCRKYVWGAGVCFCCFFVLWQIPVKGIRVTFLDVGQGDGICIQTGKSVILVDGGSSSEKELGKYSLEPYLKSQGIDQVDYAVISHGDEDHISGVKYLLMREKGVKIRTLILPWLGKGMEPYEKLEALMSQHGGVVHWMKEGERIVDSGASLSCLYHGSSRKQEEMNEHSLLLQLEYGDFEVFFTGDMSSDGEKEWLEKQGEGSRYGEKNGKGSGDEGGDSEKSQRDRAVRILKAAHHGSKYSTCEELIQKIQPGYAILSYGKRNSYGHPHQEVVERLQHHRVRIFETARSGAITCHWDGKRMRIEEMIDSGVSHPYNRK